MLERSARPALGGVPDSGLQSRVSIAGLQLLFCHAAGLTLAAAIASSLWHTSPMS